LLAFFDLSCSKGHAQKALLPVKESAESIRDIPADHEALEKRDYGDGDFIGELK
jgi:hypothetical protein